MNCYAVIDTNVIVSGLLDRNAGSASVKVLHAVFDGRITPLYHPDILSEYNDVLHRDKFHFQEGTVQMVLSAIKQFGLKVNPKPTGEIFADEEDLIFYEVVMEKREDNAYLVTGNQKHFPNRSFIVTPAEMVKILSEE